MLGDPVSGVTPLACLGNLPHPQMCYHLTPMFRHFHCPKPVEKSGFGTVTYISAKLHSSLLTKEYSVQPRLHAVKCHIMADYLQIILFFGIYVTAVGIVSPVRLLTLSHGENLDFKIKPLIAYIYLYGRVYTSC